VAPIVYTGIMITVAFRKKSAATGYRVMWPYCFCL